MAAERSAGGVGVLGGAFNPPHIGHLLLAQQAIWELDLERLVVVPTGEAPHKRIAPEPGAEVRLELARRAFAEMDRAEVSDYEVGRAGPSYAYRTLESIADEARGRQLTFVMGADAAAGIAGWERPRRVLELARVAYAARPGVEDEAVEEAIASLGGAPPRAIGMPAVEVSSTAVRERVASGAPFRWLVPVAVAERIADLGLYGNGGSQ